MARLFGILASAFAACALVHAQTPSTESIIKVAEPHDLAAELSGGVAMSIGQFGKVPWGTSLQGKLMYVTANKDGCTDFEPIDEDATKDFPAFVLVDRGECEFVSKAVHAQKYFGMVLIADNVEEDVTKVVMGDSGAGSTVQIPAALISQSNGAKLREAIVAGKTVIITVYFTVPHPDNHVEWTFWLSPDDGRSVNVVKDLAEPMTAMISNQQVEPHYAIRVCVSCQEADFNVDTPLCYGGGRWCAYDPDGVGGGSGQTVMEETVRQICISTASKAKDDMKSWWEYMAAFGATCQDKWSDMETCSKAAAAKMSGVSWQQVDKCYQDSWRKQPNQARGLWKNDILAQEFDHRIERGVYIIPSIFINDSPFRGDLTASSVKLALCAGFSAAPKECYPVHPDAVNGGNVKAWVFGLVVSLLVVLVLVAGLMYRRHVRREVRREINDHVRNIIAEYMPLTENAQAASSDKRPLL